MNDTGTTILNLNGVFPECQARIKICGYACCQFGKLGNWIATLPNEVTVAKKQNLSFNHLQINQVMPDNSANVTCLRPCVEGEFKPIDCAIYPLFPASDDLSLFIVADHRKCPIPNKELLGWAQYVRGLLLQLEEQTPGTVASMVKNGHTFKAYQAFPYLMPDCMPLTEDQLTDLFADYTFSDIESSYKLPDYVKNKYQARTTPEDFDEMSLSTIVGLL